MSKASPWCAYYCILEQEMLIWKNSTIVITIWHLKLSYVGDITAIMEQNFHHGKPFEK